MTGGAPTVLFLCGGNSCRSQMAEALLRYHGGDRFLALSAGLEPTGEVHPMTLLVLAEKGLDVSGLRSKPASEFYGSFPVTCLVTVCDAADRNCPAHWPGVEKKLHWPFPDPAAFTGTEEETLAEFRRVRDDIERRIIGRLAESGEAS